MSKTKDGQLQQALERIQQAMRDTAETLSLARLCLTALPPEIGQLAQLRGLDLDGNQLTALPPEIGQLTQLQGLYLRGNQLKMLPSEIGQLTQLRKLDFNGNQLTALPP